MRCSSSISNFLTAVSEIVKKYRWEQYASSRYGVGCSTESTETVLCWTCVNMYVACNATIFFYTVTEALRGHVTDRTLTCVNRPLWYQVETPDLALYTLHTRSFIKTD